MAKYYAASTNGFYDTDINSVIPPDAVEISHEEHRAFLDGQDAGHRISPGKDGKPVLVPPASPTALDVTTATANRAICCLSAYAFTTENPFQSSITDACKADIEEYLTAIDQILINATIAFDAGEAYSPDFPEEPEVHMKTPGANAIKIHARGL